MSNKEELSNCEKNSGLIGGLKAFLDLVVNMMEKGKDEANGSGEINAMKGKLKGVYGFKIKTGIGNKFEVEPFGNVAMKGSSIIPIEIREPLIDVIDEGKAIHVIAELPGVEGKDISAEIDGDVLRILALRGEHNYRKEVELPCAVNPDSLKSTYRNGILELRVDKSKTLPPPFDGLTMPIDDRSLVTEQGGGLE